MLRIAAQERQLCQAPWVGNAAKIVGDHCLHSGTSDRIELNCTARIDAHPHFSAPGLSQILFLRLARLPFLTLSLIVIPKLQGQCLARRIVLNGC